MSESVILVSTILFAGSLAVLLSKFLSVSRKFCYISAGIVLSVFEPSNASLVSLAQLSGLFVVFSAGSRLLPETYSKSEISKPFFSTVVRTSLVWVSVSIFCFFLDFGGMTSIFAGFAASINSTAAAVGSVGERAERRLDHARIAEASSFLGDVLAVVFLGFVVGGRLGAFLALLSVLTAFFLKSRVGVFLESLEASEHVYLFIGVVALIISVSASLGLKFGLAGGALAAGALFSQYPADVDVLESVKPLEAFFSSVFFISLGALYTYTPESVLLGVFILSGIAVLGPVITYLSLRAMRTSPHQATLAALSICSVSEIVLVSTVSVSAFTSTLSSAIIVAALGSAFLSSVYSAYSDRIYRLIEERLEHNKGSEVKDVQHTIVVGSGIIGRIVADSFENPVLLENDKSKLDKSSEDLNTVLGDARDERAWVRCNVDGADRIISTVNSDAVAEKIAAMDVDAEKYSLTASQKDSSMLDLDIGITQKDLSKAKLNQKLEGGIENGFDELREELVEQLENIT